MGFVTIISVSSFSFLLRGNEPEVSLNAALVRYNGRLKTSHCKSSVCGKVKLLVEQLSNINGNVLC
jgi:hypothetical protein